MYHTMCIYFVFIVRDYTLQSVEINVCNVNEFACRTKRVMIQRFLTTSSTFFVFLNVCGIISQHVPVSVYVISRNFSPSY